jgi:hypothetical protein
LISGHRSCVELAEQDQRDQHDGRGERAKACAEIVVPPSVHVDKAQPDGHEEQQGDDRG